MNRSTDSLFCVLLATTLFATPAFGQEQHGWSNPHLDYQTAQTQFVVDRGECAINAMQRVPMPRPSSIGAPIQDSQNGWTPSGPLAGFLAGQQAAAATQAYQRAMAAQDQAQRLRVEVFQGCMYKRGWVFR